MQSTLSKATRLPPLGEQIRGDLRAGYQIAAGFCAIAALPLMGIGLVGHIGFTDWLFTVAAVFAGYFLAATLASPVFALCRSIRGTFLGAMITGALITPIIYGTVAVTGLVVWNPVGRLLFGSHGTTQTQFLHEIPSLMGVFACVGLVAGPVMRLKRS